MAAATTPPGAVGSGLDADAWPLARVLAVVGGALGLLMGLLLLAGYSLGVANNLAVDPAVGVGLGAVGVLGALHLVLGAIVLGSAWLLLGNPRTHGVLLAVLGVLGLFLGFGFWLGAVLVLVAGILALVREPTAPMARRPVV